jgi:hypothetical protein
MNLYPFLCRHLPRPLVHALLIGSRAVLIVLVVIYSDQRFTEFAYFKM